AAAPSPTVAPPPAGLLPGGWQNQDVGTPGVAGYTTSAGSQFTVRGAGADIWNTADAFQYAYRALGGDGQLVARVTAVQSTNPFAKAGVMLRESGASNARHVILDVKPDGGVELMTRSDAGGQTTFVAGGSNALPVWVKLVRSGSTITGYTSRDGSSWSAVG